MDDAVDELEEDVEDIEEEEEEEGEEEADELDGDDEDDFENIKETPKVKPKGRRKRSILTGRGVTLGMLLDDGVIEPGEKCLSIAYLVSMSHILMINITVNKLQVVSCSYSDVCLTPCIPISRNIMSYISSMLTVKCMYMDYAVVLSVIHRKPSPWIIHHHKTSFNNGRMK